MRWPASLGGRLLLTAAAFIAVAIVLATIAIGFVLHRFVQGQIDARLDTQILFLSSQMQTGADGTIALTGDANGPPFDRPGRGWYWQILGPQNAIRSRALGDDTLRVPDLRKRRADDPHPDRPRPADVTGPDDRHLHLRVLDISTPRGTATVIASAPRDAVVGPLREALTTLAISLAILGVALISASFLQVRLGLRPLRDLRTALAELRAGRRNHLPEDQPSEIRPLVSDLNAMFAQDAANLERARRNVANLAHGLKTPLSTLALLLPKSGAPDAPAQALVVDMDRRIRHHLGRARMAALTGPSHAAIAAAPLVMDIAAALAKIHADKPLDVDLSGVRPIDIASERQDFEEIVGNILENAFKWAHSRLHVTLGAGDRGSACLRVEDDGPGIVPEQIEAAFASGKRLDETAAGFGFGLPIARELAELYGGAISLGRSSLGGLRVDIVLPAVR